MITHSTSTNTNDGVLNGSFQRVAESHLEYTITQNHVDVRKEKKRPREFYENPIVLFKVICESFLESLKNLMYQNGNEWTIKHELTWTKFYILTTNKFVSSSPPTKTVS
jgi:hypothetical protein